MSSLDRTYRDEFIIPDNKSVGAINVPAEEQDSSCVYLCGNSLGACPKQSVALVQEELDVWGKRAVEGHFHHPHGRSWAGMVDHVHPLMAEIVGAKADEVCIMGTLTANLHLMMSQFYKPTSER